MTREALKRLEAGLPAAWYYDPAHYQRELEAFWYRRWVAVAREEELPGAGDWRTVRVGTQSLVVLRDGYAPGWRAWVDEAPAAVRVAEGHYRGVAVPAGSHRLRLAYQPPGLRAGLGVMALSVCVLALLLLRGVSPRGGRHPGALGNAATPTAPA